MPTPGSPPGRVVYILGRPFYTRCPKHHLIMICLSKAECFFSLMLIWPLKYIDLNCQFTMVCMSFLSNMIVNFSVQALFPIFLMALMFCHFRYSDMFIKLVPTSLACPVWTLGKNKGSKKCYQWTKPSQNEILIWQVNELKLWVRNVISDLMKNCY